MEIIIKGSPEELAELLAGLRTEQAAGAKGNAPHSVAERKDRTFASIKPILSKIREEFESAGFLSDS